MCIHTKNVPRVRFIVNLHDKRNHDNKNQASVDVGHIKRSAQPANRRVRADDSSYQTRSVLHTQAFNQIG